MCFFSFYNKTLDKISVKLPLELIKNINKNSKNHLYNIIRKVIIMNNWNINHNIIVNCCCSDYSFKDEIMECIFSTKKINYKQSCHLEDCCICN